MQCGKQVRASGRVAGRQQAGRATRPLSVQPVHSKCSTFSGKAAAPCLAGFSRGEKLCEMEKSSEADAKYGFSPGICETQQTHFVSRHLSSACHSRCSPAAGSMRHDCCLSDQPQLTDAT